MIPWAAIDSIRTQSDSEGMETDETLIIVARGKAHKIDRSKIVNEPVMLACLRQYLPGA
jgi:protein required for attachment to host cells